VDGYPANTTTGMAYYALKHRDGEPETLDLYLHEGKVGQFAYVKQSMTADMILNSDVPLGTTLKYTLHVADYSPWLDYAACIRTFISSGKQNGWNIQYSMNEVDITTAVTSIDGFVFIREYRVRPNSVQSIVVSFTRISTMNQNAALIIELAPHRGSDVVDSLRIML
jgi:hypothetical protein